MTQATKRWGSSRLPPMVMIATEDDDFGIVSRNKARAIARELAADSACPIFIRHPITDRVLDTIHPVSKRGGKHGPRRSKR